ncbi:MAG: hypothetical protein HYZ61_01640 [Candidatus Andersenbacteria bacterium]|nr:hypothetical protein [Candidatus Andersenbacteria bacterium]
MTLLQRFLLLFFLCLCIQGYLWQHTIILDIHPWTHATEALVSWNSPVLRDPFTYGYPGTLPMLIAAGIMQLFPIQAVQAYAGSMALIISLAASSVGLLAWRLRPKTPLWLITSLLLSFNPLLTNATPPSAMVATILALTLLYVMYIEESSVSSWFDPLLLGGLLGIAATIRLDAAILFVIPILLYSTMRWAPKHTALILISSLSVFIAGNPFMMFEPSYFLTAFWDKALYHAIEKEALTLSLGSLLQYSIFAIIGAALTVISVVVPRSFTSISKRFLVLAFSITALLGISLSLVKYQAIWYTLPVVLFWEMMTPIILIDFTRFFSAPRTWRYSVTLPVAAQGVIAFIIVGGSAALYIQHLTKPSVLFLLP